MMKNLKVKKLLSKPIPKSIIAGVNKETFAWKIYYKSRKDNIILVKPFPGAHTKTMKCYASPDLEKNPDLVIIHTATNDLKSVSSPENIANETISLSLAMREKG